MFVTVQRQIWSEKYYPAAGGLLAPIPPDIHLLLGDRSSVKTIFVHMPSIGHIFLACPSEPFLKP